MNVKNMRSLLKDINLELDLYEESTDRETMIKHEEDIAAIVDTLTLEFE